MSCATCCAGGVAARAPRHPRCPHPTGPAGSRRSFPTPTVQRGRRADTALPGASPSTEEPPKTSPRCLLSGLGAHVPSGATAPQVPAHPTLHGAPPGHPDLGDLGSSSHSPQIPHPYRRGAPGPRVTPTPGGHPAGDTRDSGPRASLSAVSDPRPALPGGQEKTPRWHWGTRQGLPHLTPGDLWLPQLVPEGHPRPP